METGDTILFIGDSITDCGRREDRFKPYGCGFVTFVRNRFLVERPELKLNFVNRGIGGDTVENLYSRWVDDVVEWSPDIVVVGVGINDLNRYLTDPGALRQSPEGFEKTYSAALALTRETLPKCRILLLQPFYGGQDTTTGEYRNQVLTLLPTYHKAVQQVGRSHDAAVVDLHAAFHKRLSLQPASIYFPEEPVHPGEAGHFLIADEVYRALGSMNSKENG